jgi:hypothetical protein
MMSLSSFLITQFLFLVTFKTMQRSKIHLSPEESALVRDPSWILTKRSVMDKVAQLLADLYGAYAAHGAQAERLPEELKVRQPKLSRGENYEGLPYMVLDFPAIWSREHVFAVRTLFWWGNYFSLILHLKGRYRDRFGTAVIEAAIAGNGTPFYLAISEKEWAHQIREEDYVLATEINAQQRDGLEQLSFLKVARVIPLDQWDNVYGMLDDGFGEIMEWIS